MNVYIGMGTDMILCLLIITIIDSHYKQLLL